MQLVGVSENIAMQDKLLEMIKQSIVKTVPKTKIGVAFSGGVDSTLVSKICSDMEYDLTLLTVGFAGSHDVLFAKKISKSLRLPHHTLEIDSASFAHITKKINQKINTQNLSWNENCIAFYYVSTLANSLGVDMVVTANGVDELFCGYNAYREIFSEGASSIIKAMDAKLENEMRMMDAVNSVSSEFGVRIIQPLLTLDFIKYAKTIPISEKIHSHDDLVRKHIIRRLAGRVGVPEASFAKKKKALQYSTRIHKMLMKVRRVP